MELLNLRDYQVDLSLKAVEILKDKKIVYLSMEVRVGKTLTALETCRLYGAKSILFITKLKAISSIKSDYEKFGFNNHFELTIINKESIHKIESDNFDVVCYDEHHTPSGSFPKPGPFTKQCKKRFGDIPSIFISGTPSPESFSQFYHQFWISNYSPWKKYVNFYKWAIDYVDLKKKRIGAFEHNDYSFGIEDKIMKSINHLMITFTQEQSGFKSVITEEILYIDMKPQTYSIADRLIKDLVIEGAEEVILADTSVKLMQKLMQIYSGTCKFESGNTKVLDTSKAEYLLNNFGDKKLAIFYVFIAELEALKTIFADKLTTDLDEFNSTDKHIAYQIQSGREGTNLSKADYLFFYNIHHSATSYWQARDRMTTIDRKFNKVYFLFSRDGIEEKIYKAVQSKKKYTTNIFKKDYGK